MQIVETAIEQFGPKRIKVTTIIDLTADEEPFAELGEGPTRDTIPDRIVRYLTEVSPQPVNLPDLHDALGGNAATVTRQAWTLAENAPDLPKRLRGWVVRVGRGRYALSAAARRQLEMTRR